MEGLPTKNVHRALGKAHAHTGSPPSRPAPALGPAPPGGMGARAWLQERRQKGTSPEGCGPHNYSTTHPRPRSAPHSRSQVGRAPAAWPPVGGDIGEDIGRCPTGQFGLRADPAHWGLPSEPGPPHAPNCEAMPSPKKGARLALWEIPSFGARSSRLPLPVHPRTSWPPIGGNVGAEHQQRMTPWRLGAHLSGGGGEPEPAAHPHLIRPNQKGFHPR